MIPEYQGKLPPAFPLDPSSSHSLPQPAFADPLTLSKPAGHGPLGLLPWWVLPKEERGGA